MGATNLLFTMLAMSVIDRVGRKKLLLIGAVGTALALAGVAAIFLTGTAPGSAGVAAGRLHRVLRLFARRGDLGLPERSVSHAGTGQGTESGQLHALDHERADLRRFPRAGGVLGRRFRLCSSRR